VNPVRLIEAKRDGQEIPEPELRAFLRAYLKDDVPDYQMSAFLMAVLFRGVTGAERNVLVDEMLHSGESLSWPEIDAPVVDKHSTGGVGDKVSLVLSPLAAELGLVVPMMSGRSLGHSGGTLDKLESIPGFRTQLSLEEFRTIVNRLGCAMIGQTEEIAPLDRRLYGLRDATGTVPSIPLIAASIMSKKISEGLDVLVLDVKRGSGAFLPETEDVMELGRTMIGIGEAHGVRTHALVTAMDRPLGVAAGNALEVVEAIEILKGRGPADVREVVIELVTEMLIASERDTHRGTARATVTDCLDSGRPLERFRRLVEMQGGDPAAVDDPTRLGRASEIVTVESDREGRIAQVRPREIGWGVVELGGGRRELDDEIDPRAGIEVHARPGARIRKGAPLATIHAADPGGVEVGRRAVKDAVRYGEDGLDPLPLISHRITAGGVREVDD